MDRFILKTFAGSATNSGVFGSFKAGTPTTTTNPTSIQSAAWDNGWNDAVVTLGKFPKLEEMQGVQYVISKAVKELYKEGIPVWDADEDYYQYSIVSYTPTGETAPKLYYNLTGTYTSTNPADDTTNWAELTTSGGQGMPIGSVYPLTCAAGYVPEGSLPCDGTEYSKSQFNDLWTNYLTGGTPLLNTCSYADYATAISTYGQCAKFAVDTVNETFKVPTIKDGAVIQQALSDSELGKAYNAGLPNIEGEQSYLAWRTYNEGHAGTGAFSSSTSSGGSGSNTTDGVNNARVIFDASLSNSIYGNSNTVQPEAVSLRYFVVVADGSINQSIMDWAAWASSLAGKANTDLSDISSLAKNTVSGLSMPSGVYDNLTLGSSGAQYTAPANGYFYIDKTSSAAGQYVYFGDSTDAAPGESCGSASYANNYHCSLLRPVKKGTKVKVYYTAAGVTNYFRFIYAEGAS